MTTTHRQILAGLLVVAALIAFWATYALLGVLFLALGLVLLQMR